MLKIDLGCGKAKQDGFIGVDRYPLPKVDIIADLNAPLPIKSDSVDLLYASHSLEHLSDLMAAMREIYRICKHGAQVCIVAPYNEQKLNLANPYHICVFNEHTPRFWTDYPETPVDPEEYRHPHAKFWGLSQSDNSDPGIDIRLVSLEFFYFPEYRGLPVQRQRELRRSQIDVCDQIMYHLIVWKGDGQSPGRAFADYVADFVPFEPDYIKQRRTDEREQMAQERIEQQEHDKCLILDMQNQLSRQASMLAEAKAEASASAAQLDGARRLAEDLNSQLSRQSASYQAEASSAARRLVELNADIERAGRIINDMRGEHHQLRMQLASQYEKTEMLTDQFHAVKTALSKSQLEAESLSRTVAGTCDENLELKGRIVQLDGELDSARVALTQANADTADRFTSLVQANADTADRFTSLAQENSGLRARLENSEVLKARNALLSAEIETTNGLLAWYQSRESVLSAEAATLKAGLAEAQSVDVRRKYAETVVEGLYSQLQAYYAEKSAVFAMRDLIEESLSADYDDMRQFSLLPMDAVRGRLVMSDDLCTMPYREYIIPTSQTVVSSIAVAIRPLSLATRGVAGVEIVSAAKKIESQAVLPLNSVNPAAPTVFDLPVPLPGLEAGWALRVFVKDADVPVAVLEQARLLGLRRRMRLLPFALVR
jgi:SAM-dependent methyltransferase/chromosome segregation ATPase